MKLYTSSRPAMLQIAAAACLLPLSAVTLHAQNSTGAFSITVLDGSGAAVPGAAVTITGTETGVQLRSLKTNGEGIADIPLVPPGRYNVEITLGGFKGFQQKGVDVLVGATVSLTPQLQVGDSSDTITVTGQTPLIEDKSQTVQQVIESKELTDIPLNGRNYIQAANFIPGVVPQNAGRDNSFVAYGNDGLQNAFLLDGARNVNYLRGLDNQQRDMIRPPLDALQEFTVQTSNYSAEFGASAGALVNAITKSGTNRWHGSAYDFIRIDAADAKNYFFNSTATPRKPQLVQNQYGGSLGGKIIRDRLFFFAAYEGRHTRSSSYSRVQVPTALERSGDFSQSAFPVYDPNTTTQTGTNTYTRTQFTGNRLPSSRINALGQQLANLYPLPNETVGFSSYYDSNIPSLADVKNGIGRLDYTVSTKDSIFARYGETLTNTFTGVGLPGAQDPGNNRVDSRGIGVGYTRILSPRVVNELRFAWTTVAVNGLGTQPRNEVIPGLLDPAITEGAPTFTINNLGTLNAQAVGNTPLTKTSGVFDWADNLSWSRGAHLLKFGGEMMWIRPNTLAASNGRAASALRVHSPSCPHRAETPATHLPTCCWGTPTA